MKGPIGKAIFWIVWSRVGLQGLTFLSTLIVVRILSPADYGLMALAGVWIYIVSRLVEMDLGSAIIQFPDLEDTELNACFWLTTSLTLGGCLVLAFASPYISDWFSAPRLADILPIVALTLLFAGVKVVPYALLKKNLEFDKVSKTEIVASLLSIVIMLSMAWGGAGVWALVAGTLVPMVGQSIGSFWFVRWRPGFCIKGKRVGQMILFSLRTTGSTISWAIYAKAPALILGKVTDQTSLGFYSIAMEIATALSTKISLMVQQLAFPVMSKLQNDIDTLRYSLLRSIRMVACISFPLSVGTLLVADDFIVLTLTEKWASVVPLLQLLSVYALFQSMCFLFPIVLKVRYRVSFILGYSLTLLVVMPMAFWVGAQGLGATGVALVWIAVYPILTIWMIREACKEIELGWAILWKQISFVSWATLVMAGSVLIIQYLVLGNDWFTRALRISLGISLGGISYVMVLLLLGNQVAREAREVVGWIFGLSEPIEMKHLKLFCYRFPGGKVKNP